jgi:hypothetical protein
MDTWAYAERARSVTQVQTIELPNGDHAMLRGDRGRRPGGAAQLPGDSAPLPGDSGPLHGARLWHRIAAEFTRTSLGLPQDGP